MVVAVAPAAGATVDGSDIITIGNAPNYGSLVSLGIRPNEPVLGLASDADGLGYWMVASDGGIFSFGGAPFYGSMGGTPLNQPMVGMAARHGGGYWLFAADGGVFSFGGAPFYGSMGGHRLNAPVVAMVATPSGAGYLLIAADGGVFAFGEAKFLGSTGSNPPPSPIAGAAVLPDGSGYWLYTRTGQVIAFGAALTNLGDLTPYTLSQPVVGMAATFDGKGYWLAQADGQVWKFGDATLSEPTQCLAQPVVALAARPPLTDGLWLATAPRPALNLVGFDPIAVDTSENADITAMLKIRQACQPAATTNSITWVKPIDGALVTELYGWRIHPIYKVPQFHAGIDLVGANTTIRAAAPGKIVEVSSRAAYGTVVIIDHGGKISSVYAHLSKTTVTVGQTVNAGDQVGVMGMTGYATGPHLHFEIRVTGDTVDPKPVLGL